MNERLKEGDSEIRYNKGGISWINMNKNSRKHNEMFIKEVKIWLQALTKDRVSWAWFLDETCEMQTYLRIQTNF